MVKSLLLVCLLVFSDFFDSSAPPVNLFDGRTFRGWAGDTTNTWHIQDGALVGGSLTKQVPHNDFLCTTRSYANFELTLQWKLVGSGFVNGGVQLCSQRLMDPGLRNDWLPGRFGQWLLGKPVRRVAPE